MGSMADKIKGNTNEAIGKAKQGLGRATGSEQLEGEGAIQEIKGKGPEGPWRRQASHQGRREQRGRGGQPEAVNSAYPSISQRPVRWTGLCFW